MPCSPRPAPPPPQELHIEIRLLPTGAEHPWRATLREHDSTQEVAFDSPFDLMRHLAQRLTAPRRPTGLR
jgi:hypothetical protein